MKRLFVGPWVGEFGIELLRWQGYARNVAAREDWDEVIVATQPDRFFLYEDFATKFIPYELPSIHTEANRCEGHFYEMLHRDFIDERNGDTWLSPLLDKSVWNIVKHEFKKQTTYVNFADRAAGVSSRFDLLVHARSSIKHAQHEKNWPIPHWNELLAELGNDYSIASIGAPEGAYHIEGTTDLRGIPLAELAGYCRNARLVIGPSSGTMHFAVLSGTPIVTWVHTIEPYRNCWNPFAVPLCAMPTWQPTPAIVTSKVRQLLTFLEKPPVDYFVFGTKRSGHHAIIDWIAALDAEREIVHFNDCCFQQTRSTPPEDFHIPTPFSSPKLINEPKTNNAVCSYNESSHSERASLFSFEDIPLSRIPEIPELHPGVRFIFVLRDAANFLSSLEKGISWYYGRHFTDDAFRRILRIYKEYLREALRKTTLLGPLRENATFISFNRWHSDQSYREEVSRSLDFDGRDAPRDRISRYGPGSSFDKDPATDARSLDILNRWTHFADRNDFHELLDDPELGELEKEFHGAALPSRHPLLS